MTDINSGGCVQQRGRYLGELCLGKARLAHLRGLTHGDVALGQWPLREGLGGPILTGLAVSSQALTLVS